MPSMPAAGAAGCFSSGLSVIIHSVVSKSPATLAAFCRAERVTLVGSTTPALSRSSNFPVATLYPILPLKDRTSFTTKAPSSPAFAQSWRRGASMALRTIWAPTASSPSSCNASIAFAVRKSATLPPALIPSSTAARVACRASSTRAFFSFISGSVAAPIFMTATPPASFASLS